VVSAVFLCVLKPQTAVLGRQGAARGRLLLTGWEEGRNQTKASAAAAWAWEEREPRAADVGRALPLPHQGPAVSGFELAAACR